MNKKFSLLPLIVAVYSFSSGALDCAAPSRKQILIVWNGWTTDPAFELGAKATIETLGRNASRVIFMNGGELDPKTKAFRPGWHPKVDSNTTILGAKATDFLKVPSLITQAIEEFRKKDPSIKNEDVEVQMIITNHGNFKPGLQGQNSYYITPDPRFKDEAVGRNEINKFSEKIPKGIRYKGVFEQCFGSNTLRYFIDALQNRASCACGFAWAAPGRPTYQRGNPKNSKLDNDSWLQRFAESSDFGKKSSLLSSWQATAKLDSNHTGWGPLTAEGPVNDQYGQDAVDINLSSSEEYALSVLHAKTPTEQTPGELGYFWPSLETSKKLLGKGDLADINTRKSYTFDQAQSTADKMIAETVLNHEKLDPDMAKAAGNDSPWGLKQMSRTRQDLLKLFSKVATKQELDRFIALRKCELAAFQPSESPEKIPESGAHK